MRPSYRPAIPPQPQPSRTQVWDPLGLVAGMCAELGITEVIDKATRQDPARRMVTAGHAVTAMVLNGLGCVNQPRSLVPHFFPNKPRSRLIAPGMQASHLNDDTRGRALDTLYAYGVTALSSLIAAPAAKRLGLAPTCTHLASPSFHVAGRSHSAPEPEAEIMHIPWGSRRDHRPDLHHGRLELIVEPQAGLPLLLQPLSGHSSDAHACGQVSKAPLAQWQTTDGLPDRVADSALSSADHLQKFAETHRTWLTRVPATLRAAHQMLAQADPQHMAPLTEGDRSHGVPSRDGGIAQRWLLVYSEPRHVQAQRPGDKPRRKPGQQEGAAFQTRRRMTFAWDADAQHALATCTPGWHATVRHDVAVRATPRSGTRGRPRQDAPPAQIVSTIAGTLASCLATRSPLVDQQSGCSLATHARDETLVPPTALCASYTGQRHAERGVRCLQAPQFFASALSLKKPERMMALLMIMTVCLLVYAALEYRIRTALKAHGATWLDPKNTPTQTPTARWGFHACVGMHVLFIPQQGLIVLNLTEEHQRLLQLLGARYAWFYR